MENKLKVGDKCRVVANTCGHNMGIGHESKIDEIYFTGIGYYVDGWAVDDDDVELINDKEETK